MTIFFSYFADSHECLLVCRNHKRKSSQWRQFRHTKATSPTERWWSRNATCLQMPSSPHRQWVNVIMATRRWHRVERSKLTSVKIWARWVSSPPMSRHTTAIPTVPTIIREKRFLMEMCQETWTIIHTARQQCIQNTTEMRSIRESNTTAASQSQRWVYATHRVSEIRLACVTRHHRQ